MLIGFEHVGMTSGDMDRSIAFYRDLLGLTLRLRKANADNEVAFLDAGGGMLEIIAPKAGAGRFRDVPMSEAGMRHLTLAYESVDAMFDKLEAAGVEIVERPRDAHNKEMVRRVAFIRDPDGIIVELIERAEGR
jgi:glyoxylase I family protein